MIVAKTKASGTAERQALPALRRLNDVSWTYKDAPFRFRQQASEGVLNAYQSRVGCGTVEHHIQPVVQSQGCGLGPLVLSEFDCANLRPALDLDRQPATILAESPEQ